MSHTNVRRPLATTGLMLVWAYVACVALWLLLNERTPQSVWWLADWCAVPLQAVAFFAVALLLIKHGTRPKGRAALWLVLAFTAVSAVATVVWNFTYTDPHGVVFKVGDALYLVVYLLITITLVRFYITGGGRPMTWQFWLDALTVGVVLLAVYAQFMSSEGIGVRLGLGLTVAYVTMLSLMMVMCALLLAQRVAQRGQLAVVLLIAAAVIEACVDYIWVAGQLNGHDYANLFYSFGDVLCFALITTAAYAQRFKLSASTFDPTAQERISGFLPAFLALLIVAVLAGASSSSQTGASWMRIALLLAGAGLLGIRQRAMQREIGRLNSELTIRQSNERATELVRSSTDLIAVCNASRQLVFVSPAAQAILQRSPAELLHTPADLLLGRLQQRDLATFLDRLASGAEHEAECEMSFATTDGEQRILRITGTNHTGNPLINGIVLSFSDVTSSRGLEREIINVATRERLRLCSDIHEGLGQELSGIALLLHSAAAHPSADPQAQRRSLESIVSYVNQSIETTRNLAEALSPIQIARGSLVAALERLAREVDERLRLPVTLHAPAEEPFIDAALADHLYRIAQEATSNAIRHCSCTRIEIRLTLSGRLLELQVHDDGRGMEPLSLRSRGLGHRMMGYRARLIGGTLEIDSQPGRGTCVTVRTSLPADT